MTRALVLGWIVAMLAAAPPGPSPPTSRAEGGRVRVLSFNIRYGTADDGPNAWPKRRELVFDVFRSRRPDLVGLQEALRDQLDEIATAAPEYAELGGGRRDGRTEGEYTAILYRTDRFSVGEQGMFWFSETPEVPNTKGWGNRVSRTCTWARLLDARTGRWLYLYNVHLDHESQPSRERSVELLVRRIAARAHPDDPVVVTGDFNAGEGNPAIEMMRRGAPRPRRTDGDPPPAIPFADTFRVLHPEAKRAGTFGGFHGRRDGRKIDYIFTGAAIRVIEAEIVYDNDEERYPSDHYPVTATIELD